MPPTPTTLKTRGEPRRARKTSANAASTDSLSTNGRWKAATRRKRGSRGMNVSRGVLVVSSARCVVDGNGRHPDHNGAGRATHDARSAGGLIRDAEGLRRLHPCGPTRGNAGSSHGRHAVRDGRGRFQAPADLLVRQHERRREVGRQRPPNLLGRQRRPYPGPLFISHSPAEPADLEASTSLQDRPAFPSGPVECSHLDLLEQMPELVATHGQPPTIGILGIPDGDTTDHSGHLDTGLIVNRPAPGALPPTGLHSPPPRTQRYGSGRRPQIGP